MTLTAEQVRQYEARAAAGEKPYPWDIQTHTERFEREVVHVDAHGRINNTQKIWVYVGTWAKKELPSEVVLRLAADDALAAFAAPLLEREVVGPWKVYPHGCSGTCFVTDKLPPFYDDGEQVDHAQDAAEARAIANVRNAHHARRQAKEAGK